MEINGDPLPDVQHVYLLQPREFLKTKESIFKIGRTVREASERLREYSKSSKTILVMVVKDCCQVEEDLKRAFDSYFHQRSDIGRESYQGDVLKMIRIFTEVVQASYITDTGDIREIDIVPSPGQLLFADGILPFTEELVKSRFHLYTPDLVTKGQEGFVEFILRITEFTNGRNYKCLDAKRILFARLDTTGGWTKDSGAKFLNCVFTARDMNDQSLMDKFIIRYAEIATQMINADGAHRGEIKTEQETIRYLFSVCENEKMIRAKFIKGVAENLADVFTEKLTGKEAY